MSTEAGQVQRAKLLGLDMPTKHAAPDPTGKRESNGIIDEMRRQLLERWRRRKERENATLVDREPVN